MREEAGRSGSTFFRFFRFVKSAIIEQQSLLNDMWSSNNFLIPMSLMWAFSLGGSVGSPVLTFFFLQLGATEIDLGWIGLILSGSSMLCLPLWGMLMDRQSSYLVMLLSCVVCGIGCLLRGLSPSLLGLYISTGILGLANGRS